MRTIIRPTAWSPVWVAAAVILPLLIVAATPMNAVDLAYHLRVGAMIIDVRGLLRTDVLTFTAAGQEWVNQQWLSQVILATVFRGGGWLALQLLRVVLAGLSLGLLCRAAKDAGVSTRVAAWLTLGAAVLLLPTLQLRPQLFGVVCFTLVLWLTAIRQRRSAAVWWIVPVVLLWTNLHGTFVLTFAVLGLAWLQEVQARGSHAGRLIVVGLASLAVTLLNPLGPRVWAYVFTLSGNPVVRTLAAEWQATSFDSFSGAAFLLSLPVVAFVLWRTRRRVTWPNVMGLLTFGGLGFMSVRGVYWWGMFAPVALAGTLASPTAEEPVEPESGKHTLFIGGLGLMLVLICVRWFPYRTDEAPAPGMLMEAPAGITAALRTMVTPGEPVFNAQAWGSWLELALPGNPVAVDSRIELFSRDVWDRYARVSTAQPDWEQILEEWHVRIVVVNARQQPILLRQLLQGSPRWQQQYRDADGAVFVRR